MKMKAYTVCAKAHASIFMAFWLFSQNKIVKLLKKSERWPNKWSKVKTLEDTKSRSGWPFFHKLCEKYYRKSCKYMRNDSTTRKGKKIQLHIIDQSFEHNGMGISYPQKVGRPWREKCGAYFMRAWCQKDLPTLNRRRTDRQTHVMWAP